MLNLNFKSHAKTFIQFSVLAWAFVSFAAYDSASVDQLVRTQQHLFI